MYNMTKLKELELQLKAVANARRLHILKYIKEKKGATVGEIAKELHISHFPTSQHLRILKAAGIVKYSKKWKYVFYRLALPQKEPIKKVISLL